MSTVWMTIADPTDPTKTIKVPIKSLQVLPPSDPDYRAPISPNFFIRRHDLPEQYGKAGDLCGSKATDSKPVDHLVPAGVKDWPHVCSIEPVIAAPAPPDQEP